MTIKTENHIDEVALVARQERKRGKHSFTKYQIKR